MSSAISRNALRGSKLVLRGIVEKTCWGPRGATLDDGGRRERKRQCSVTCRECACSDARVRVTPWFLVYRFGGYGYGVGRLYPLVHRTLSPQVEGVLQVGELYRATPRHPSEIL